MKTKGFKSPKGGRHGNPKPRLRARKLSTMGRTAYGPGPGGAPFMPPAMGGGGPAAFPVAPPGGPGAPMPGEGGADSAAQMGPGGPGG